MILTRIKINKIAHWKNSDSGVNIYFKIITNTLLQIDNTAINLYTSFLGRLYQNYTFLIIRYLLQTRNYETSSTQPAQGGYVDKAFATCILVYTCKSYT